VINKIEKRRSIRKFTDECVSKEKGQLVGAVAVGYVDEKPNPRPRKKLEEIIEHRGASDEFKNCITSVASRQNP
jgi:nitroreductase